MPYGLYISADGAQAQSKRLEVITNNLANVGTVGFKRQLALFQARYAEQVQRGEAVAGSGSINDVGGGVLVQQTETDFSPGPMKRTEIPTDMAIEGEGFFVVQKDNQQLLTRAGNFRVNGRGELVTQQGYPVLNDSDSPIVIDPANGPWQLMPSGTIQQRGTSQNLAIVRPESLGDLARVGENLFRPLAAPEPVPSAERQVAGGCLEMSGAEPTTEMMDLIQTSRAVEANLNMMRTQDQMLSGLVNRVMRTG
jgi:flagellar basal-body rod protein FlgF